MKRLVSFMVLVAALTGSTNSYAQRPADQKPVQIGSGVQSSSHEVKVEDKREELSKKLLQRKNELRKEERDHAKERRTTDIHEKSSEVKKN